MKLNKLLFAALSLSLLTSCGETAAVLQDRGMGLNQADHVTYLCLSKIGTYSGSAEVKDDIPELFLENTIVFTGEVGSALPTKDEVKATSGAIFKSWVSYEGDGAPVEYTTVPAENNKILYAYFVSSNIKLTSLTYTGTPTKTTYDLDNGETTFDPTGIIVTATYSDGSTETVANDAISWGALKVGATSVTGTYGGLSITVTGLTITGTVTEVTYTIQDMPTWVTNDGCVIFAWAWGGSDAGDGKWFATTYTSTTTLTFTVADDVTGLLMARCVAGTTTPDWNIKSGDSAGRVYNQTENIETTAGVYTYSAPDSIWKGYP